LEQQPRQFRQEELDNPEDQQAFLASLNGWNDGEPISDKCVLGIEEDVWREMFCENSKMDPKLLED
jgi:hypothetical protein